MDLAGSYGFCYNALVVRITDKHKAQANWSLVRAFLCGNGFAFARRLLRLVLAKPVQDIGFPVLYFPANLDKWNARASPSVALQLGF
jgi:hypothetical protein